MKFIIRLEKTIQEKRFEPFKAEFVQEFDSEFWDYEEAIEHSLNKLEKIIKKRMNKD